MGEYDKLGADDSDRASKDEGMQKARCVMRRLDEVQAHPLFNKVGAMDDDNDDAEGCKAAAGIMKVMKGLLMNACNWHMESAKGALQQVMEFSEGWAGGGDNKQVWHESLGPAADLAAVLEAARGSVSKKVSAEYSGAMDKVQQAERQIKEVCDSFGQKVPEGLLSGALALRQRLAVSRAEALLVAAIGDHTESTPEARQTLKRRCHVVKKTLCDAMGDAQWGEVHSALRARAVDAFQVR